MWVNNANYIRKRKEGYNIQNSVLSDEYKKAAEKRMVAMDKLPREARLAVHEYGQLKAAVRCSSRKAVDKVAAVQKAYQRKLEMSSVKLDTL